MRGAAPCIGIVIPVHDERMALPELLARLDAVRRASRKRWALHYVFVDDASRDGSGDWLWAQAQAHVHISLVQLAQTTGQQRALCAGLMLASGDALVSLDADLQDPPERIADMLDAWAQGAEVVYGVRTQRLGDTWVKRICAAVFYRVFNLLTALEAPNDCGDFRLLDRRIVEALRTQLGPAPYLRGTIAAMACSTRRIGYVRAPRCAGASSYTWSHMLALAWQACAQFAAPERLTQLCVLGTCLSLVLSHVGHARLPAMWVAAGLCAAMVPGMALAVWRRCTQRSSRWVRHPPHDAVVRATGAGLAPQLKCDGDLAGLMQAAKSDLPRRSGSC